MAAFAMLRERSDFKAPYFDYAVVSCNLFGDIQNTTHWERFSELATYDLYSQLPKMITDEEVAEKKAIKERNKLMRLIQSNYISIPSPERLFIDVYRAWQTLGDTGACCRALVLMMREGYKVLSLKAVEKAFSDRYYDTGDFFESVFLLNEDVRGGVITEFRLIKFQMFSLRNDVEIFYEYTFGTITNYLKSVKKYMKCGNESCFFSNYFSYNGVFNRKELKFKEYLLVTLQGLMTQLIADMEEIDDVWSLLVAKIFYDDLMPVERSQMYVTVKKESLMEIKEMQHLFKIHGYNTATVNVFSQFINEKFGWSAVYADSFIEFGLF